MADDIQLAQCGDVEARQRGPDVIYLVCGSVLVDHPDDGRPAVKDWKTGRTRHLTKPELGDLAAVDRLLAATNDGGETVDGPRLVHRSAKEVKMIPPVWLWTCWLVAGAVHLLVGRQGSGKSTFAAWLVAQLSTGRPWPGDTEPRAPVRCGMLSLEEPDERLAARLIAVGADLAAVDMLGQVEDLGDHGRYLRPWRLPADCTALENTIRHLGLGVVTIDGLGYAIAGDSHNYATVGSALSALAGVAERTGCAILGLTHPPKGNSDAVTAAIGSTAWTALARISWVMGGDPGDDTGNRRVVRPAPGSNYRLPDHGLSFTIGNHDETEAGFVTGLQSSDVDPQAITSPPAADTEEERSALDTARDFLRGYLGMGAMKAAEVITAAGKQRIAETTLTRARIKERVDSRRQGFGPGSVIWWSLPAIDAIDAIDAKKSHRSQPPESGAYDESWRLCGDKGVTGDASNPNPNPTRHQ